METNHETLAVMLEKMASDLLVAAKGLRDNWEIPVAPQAAIEQAKRGVCLACDGKDQPPNRPLKRGQCVNCYAKTLRRIKSGKLTSRHLIEAGKLLSPANGGKKDDDFLADLARAEEIAANEIKRSTAQQNAQQDERKKRRKAKH